MDNIAQTQKMLRAIMNGQSAMKQELLNEIKKLDIKFDVNTDALSEEIKKSFSKNDSEHKEIIRMLDLQGKALSYLGDDTPTREEHDDLDKRVTNLEDKLSSN